MTLPQWTAVAILAGMMGLFIWGRLRYDLVAILALLAALAAGVVKPKDAFTGFSDDIVIIVGSALVISGAVQRSGVIESGLARLTRGAKRTGTQVLLLAGSVGFLSALVKNIGALSMLMPSAFTMAKRSGGSASVFLMPMSFASLLGGLITLVGTSPNIIVSRVREEMTGEPFRMFDYAPVGLTLTVLGLVFLRFAYRLLPADRKGSVTLGEAMDISDYVTEARVAEETPPVGETIATFVQRHSNEVAVNTLVRGELRSVPLPDARIRAGDTLILAGEPDVLERVIAGDALELAGQDRQAATGTGGETGEEIGVIEAVVGRQSALAGRSAGTFNLHDRFNINLIAVSRAGERFSRKLRDIVLKPGDVIVLQGALSTMPQTLRDLDCLPLAERTLRLGSRRRRWLPIAILAVAMAATAMGAVPVAVAFFAAAGLIMITGVLPAREAYDQIEWPILIMLGALIPVSDALRTTGATKVIADILSHTAAQLPPWGAVALILAAAMAVTPFLNNAATVLVMAPIAGTFAGELGYRPEAFLMAVAVGAGSDFLTPIGHQCNTLVMGPGGYRFADYARLGAPLSLLVLVVGTPLIVAVWPLR